MKVVRCLAFTALTTAIFAVYIVVPLAVTLRPFLGGLAISLVASLGCFVIGAARVVSILYRSGPSVRDGLLEPHTVLAAVPQTEPDIFNHRLAVPVQLRLIETVTTGPPEEMNAERA